ncbi:host specificity protein [bacterium]|nr:host specificity protein [bacterium]
MVRTYKQRLDAGELVLSIAVGRVLHHNHLQMIGMAGAFHGVWLDMEHVGLTTEQLEVATLACRATGMDSFCRVAPTDYATVTRCLEAGAGGVMAAQIFTAAQAEQFVQWAKFAPRGQRGLNTGGVDAGFTTMKAADFTKKANEETFVLIQIETLQAVEECEAIAAIEGVDALFIGPADLSQSLGVTGQFFHEKCLAAIDKVAAACKQHGKHLAAVAFNPEHAQMLYDKGCRFISPTTDVRVVQAGLQSVQREFATMFEQGKK